MERELLINIFLLFGTLCFLILYRFMRRAQSHGPKYSEIYDKIINSDEYKVKGQYDE